MLHTSVTRRVVATLLAMSLPVLATAQPASAVTPRVPDFDAGMRGLGFNPLSTDGNGGAGNVPNGMLDADEMALVSTILARPDLDLRKSKGVTYTEVRAAWTQALASATEDVKGLAARYPTAAEVAAGYAMVGPVSFAAYNEMTTTFGAPLSHDYSLAKALGRYLAFDGDADGDGVSNSVEYQAQMPNGGRAAYLRAVLDPTITSRPAAAAGGRASTSSAAVAATTASTRKTVGVVLYPGYELLDVFGPVEMWSYVPEFKVIMIAQQTGPVRSAQGVQTIADYSFETAPALDIVMVPGGNGTFAELKNPVLLDFLRKQNERTSITASVCTGSALLARAGILAGHRATSNKAFFSLAVDQDPTVEWVLKARWVDDGKFVTSSGVSAGTDMALGLVAKLYGVERARTLARSLEYQWNEDPHNDPFALTQMPPPRTVRP